MDDEEVIDQEEKKGEKEAGRRSKRGKESRG